uniref:Ig-like domain-containing protein n=1 Tax=Oreochromis niloticus TaxID=8128 RepID=A0A669BX82_ORENI
MSLNVTLQRVKHRSCVAVSLRCMLFCLCPGEILVVGSNLPTVAAPGDTVVLPCHLEPTFDVRGLTVEWSKLGLKPDPSDRLSRVEYVHLYRDKTEVPDMKIASYVRRTELFADAMKHGNISLKITNVSEGDAGRYRCFVPKLQSRVKFAIVELVAPSSHSPQSTTKAPSSHSPQARGRPGVIAALIMLLIAIAVLSRWCIF